MNIFFRAYFRKKNLTENLFWSGSLSGAGSGHFQKSDQDPVKNRHDPQHC
jgi:hypothetical protein